MTMFAAACTKDWSLIINQSQGPPFPDVPEPKQSPNRCGVSGGPITKSTAQHAAWLQGLHKCGKGLAIWFHLCIVIRKLSDSCQASSYHLHLDTHPHTPLPNANSSHTPPSPRHKHTLPHHYHHHSPSPVTVLLHISQMTRAMA